MSPLKLYDFSWKIVTVTQPVMFHRTLDEVWLLNRRQRYILNAHQIPKIQDFIDTMSDLDSGSLYHPLRANTNITHGTILIERLRDRGIGDLMFMTGPLAFINHITGRNVSIDFYALSDRGMVLHHNDDLTDGCVLCGALSYDSLVNYSHHWFVSALTESDEEPDQMNVYDALYRQLGFDPATIDPQWKRPKAVCEALDYKHLDQMFYLIFQQQKIDLRRIGYYVVAPFSASSLRSMNYGRWLEIIRELASRRPVVVVGSTRIKLPDMDVSAGAFVQAVAQLGGQGIPVINAIDGTPLRVLMALISRAKGLIGLDSGPLYLAQGLRTPAVSLWGSHAPGVRLVYDKDYMDLAVWNEDLCVNSPCFAYLNFPENKCPRGRLQTCCEVLAQVPVDQVLKKVDMIETATPRNIQFKAK